MLKLAWFQGVQKVGVAEMISIEQKTECLLDLFGREDEHDLETTLPEWRRRREQVGSFLPCFQLHELKSPIQVQCILLKAANKIPLCSPLKLISEELHYFLWDRAPQMCRGRPAGLHCLRLECKNGHFVLQAESDTHSPHPCGGYQVDNFLLRGGATGSRVVCVQSCFVPLWTIFKAQGENEEVQCRTTLFKLYSMEPFQRLETPVAGGPGWSGWEQQVWLQALPSASSPSPTPTVIVQAIRCGGLDIISLTLAWLKKWCWKIVVTERFYRWIDLRSLFSILLKYRYIIHFELFISMLISFSLHIE